MKYSILPATDNATMRLQCFGSSHVPKIGSTGATSRAPMTMISENLTQLSIIGAKHEGRKSLPNEFYQVGSEQVKVLKLETLG